MMTPLFVFGVVLVGVGVFSLYDSLSVREDMLRFEKMRIAEVRSRKLVGVIGVVVGGLFLYLG